MKKNILVSLFVVFFFSLYVMSSPIIWAAYFVYQDYITETFCVNKQNPDCCGKCYVIEVDNEQPKNDLPKIEVRTPELTSFTIDKIYCHLIDAHTLLLFSPFHHGDVSNGFTLKLTQPPEQNSRS
jgi:hypothetical protein